MSTHDVDGLNAGYARALLDEYLENPEAVPSEWRALFESGDSSSSRPIPGIARLLELLAAARRQRRTASRPPPSRPPQPRRARSSTAARRRRARRAAARRRRRRDGARQGAPHPRPSRRAPRPARLRAGRRPVARAAAPRAEADARAAGAHPRVRPAGRTFPARRSPTSCRELAETYCGTIAYELEHLSDHQQRVWLRQAIESGRYRAAAQRRGEEGALPPPLRGRGHGAVPAQAVPRPEAVLARRAST